MTSKKIASPVNRASPSRVHEQPLRTDISLTSNALNQSSFVR